MAVALLSLCAVFEAAAGEASERGGKAAKPGTSEGGAVLSDPENVKGVSDFEAKLAEGRQAFAKKELARARAAFDEAIVMKPEEARGYHLLAQTQLEKGERDAALATVDKGLAKTAADDVAAKLLALRAELLEHQASVQGASATGGSATETADIAEARKGAWEKASIAYGAYQVFLAAHARVPDHQATAAERKKQIAARKQRETQYAVVKSKRENS